ncbi:MAG: protein translocase subunit SecD [Dehalococcoidia bacterium]|nr:protein translocase subunit SecD [Dehalococcoidia bacterium]
MNKNSWWLLFIVALFAMGLYFILPPDSSKLGRQGFKLGLDLQGGTQLIYEADLSKKDPTQTDSQVMNGVKQKIERRVNAYGVSEAVVQVGGANRILVQLPGVKDINQAKSLIGQTGLLQFKSLAPENWNASLGSLVYTENGQQQTVSFSGVTTEELKRLEAAGEIKWADATATGSNGGTEVLSGKYLKPTAQPSVSQDGTSQSQVIVLFEWNTEGARLSEQITRGLLNSSNAPMGIFLDNGLISAPRVNGVISDKGEISGGFTLDSAKVLADTLNSGSLDVPLTVIQQQNVDATAGADSLRRSLFAGAVGLAMVLLFMVVSYRLPGALAGVALFMYGALLLSIFKAIPVTMSLPGIAGVVISIGMAVDANVLVFERLKEELRTGISYSAAVEKGFNRAWLSIRDSNISTIITCIILYWFGTTFGASMVQGFALTLLIGVLVSMFTAITATRTLIRVFIGTRISRKPAVAKV